MGLERIKTESDYESLRNARISENQARLASLGLDKSISELRKVISSRKPAKKTPRKYTKSLRNVDPVRRSNRLKGIDPLSQSIPLRSRGSVYDPVFGICCHFCRQKKLCGEEDCRRCGELDMDQPCMGKTDCSVCHSTNGVLCRACLKVRYGEEMEEVRENKEWMCPHCIEEKGINPYWICNSSFCLKKRKMIPTGIAIFEEIMKKTPSRRLPSHLNINGRVDVDLRQTVQFLKNNGINVTVRDEEPPPIVPTVVAEGKEKASSKEKRKALTINSPPTNPTVVVTTPLPPPVEPSIDDDSDLTEDMKIEIGCSLTITDYSHGGLII